MSDDTNTNEGFTDTSTPVAVKATRMSWSFDEEAGTATLNSGENEPEVYSLSEISNANARFLAYLGTTIFLGRQEDRAAAFAKLKSETRVGRVGGPKPAKELNPWKLAIAHHAVDVTKKASVPLTLEVAKANAATMAPAEVKAMKTVAGVVKHYNRLTGITTPSVPAWMQAAA